MADQQPASEYLLSPYRVLDLTDDRGLLCGKILADLGADVIQVEPPAGNPARRLGPFANDDVRPENSLFWWAYAANKRSITLDIETVDGCNLLRRLAERADFLASEAGITQDQFDLMIREYAWRVKCMFTPSQYSWLARIGLAIHFLNPFAARLN